MIMNNSSQKDKRKENLKKIEGIKNLKMNNKNRL